jgi:hypothetical protein
MVADAVLAADAIGRAWKRRLEPGTDGPGQSSPSPGGGNRTG